MRPSSDQKESARDSVINRSLNAVDCGVISTNVVARPVTRGGLLYLSAALEAVICFIRSLAAFNPRVVNVRSPADLEPEISEAQFLR